MLDTDSVSFAWRGRGRIAERILVQAPSSMCISSISLAELRYGADLRGSRRLHALVDAFVAPLAVVPFDEKAAARFGAVAASLTRAGRLIGPMDALIGAHALSLGVVLVTHHTKHFSRIEGLKTDDWL
jgi:tRNA(fMet)-specific endonuclease VapC